MIGHQLALIKREIWEHRSIYVTPLAIASIVTLGTLAAIIFASGFAHELDMAIFGATNIAGDAERRMALTGFFVGTSWLFVLALMVLIVFYSLDSLYAERKDKSILFWRSMPVTDAEAVISKLLTAIFVIPLATFVAMIGTHIINLIITSIWVATKGGDVGHLIWGSVPLFSDWLAALIVIVAGTLWMSPLVGWFLFVSAYTKRSPLLMAFLPLVLIPLIELIFFRSHYFAETVLGRPASIPLLRNMDLGDFFDSDSLHVSDQMASLLGHLDVARFISSPSVWAGIVACGLLTTGAIYVRRFRDDS